MKRTIIKAGLNAMVFAINLQLRNKQLPKWARKELEDDRAEFEYELTQLRKANQSNGR
jgi:hypothetical protein